jgi:glycosyltransferase involved in cell wall biosynthesis
MLYKLISYKKDPNIKHSVVSLVDKGEMKERLSEIGVSVRTLDMNYGRPSIKGLLNLKSVMAEVEPDIIQGWMYHGNIATSISNIIRIQSLPTLWNVRHSLYSINKEKKLTQYVIRVLSKISSIPSKIIYNSKISKRQHETIGFEGGSKSLVIPNGFDMNKYSRQEVNGYKVRKELGISSDTVLIGKVARYHKMKDHDNFLKAARILGKKFSNVHFLLAGIGINTFNHDINKKIKDLGIKEKISLLGQRDDIPDINDALDISSLSSAWGEAFPNVVGEAMATRTPCVVTDVGDSGYIVGDCGKVVSPDNPEALAEGWMELIELGESGRRELGEQARDRISNKFSITKVVDMYERLYRQVY